MSIPGPTTAIQSEHLHDAAVAAACRGRGRPRHARPQSAAAHARIRAARRAHRGAVFGRRRMRQQDAAGALPRPRTARRCLKVCPADAVGHWSRDWPACDTFRSPHGFPQLTDHITRIIAEPDIEKQKDLLRSEDSFNLWQSILRGAGVITGCRRCADVCPVGADYEAMLQRRRSTRFRKIRRRRNARRANGRGRARRARRQDGYRAQARWIGELRRRLRQGAMTGHAAFAEIARRHRRDSD